MNRIITAALLVTTLGCGAVLNGGPATIIPPPGAMIDGVAGPIMADKKVPHEVIYPNGARCIVQTRVSAGYVVVDIVFLFLLGVVVDAVTGDWATLDASYCPGVIVQG